MNFLPTPPCWTYLLCSTLPSHDQLQKNLGTTENDWTEKNIIFCESQWLSVCDRYDEFGTDELASFPIFL